jgi:hypothetical protein
MHHPMKSRCALIHNPYPFSFHLVPASSYNPECCCRLVPERKENAEKKINVRKVFIECLFREDSCPADMDLMEEPAQFLMQRTEWPKVLSEKLRNTFSSS